MQPVSPAPASPALLNPTAVSGRRIVAWFLDALIGTVLIFGYAASTFTNTTFGSNFEAELQCELINDLSTDFCVQANETVYVGSGGATAGVVLIWFGWVIVASVLLPALTGWSPGKLLVGLRVAKVGTLEKAGFGANLVRTLLWVLDAFPYFLPGLGGVMMLATRQHQRLGDFAGGTVVIRAASLGRPPVAVTAPASAPPPGVFAPPATSPIMRDAPASPPPPTGSMPPPPVSPATPPPPNPTPPPPVSPATPPPPNPTPPPPGPVPVTPLPPVFPPAPGGASQPPVFPPPTPDPTPPAPEPFGAPQSAPVDGIPAPTSEPILEAQPILETPPFETAPEPVTGPPTETPNRPGVEAPMWDEARDTYIQWDPELDEWMEWSEAQGRWVPISR